jgi:hypothetical protein
VVNTKSTAFGANLQPERSTEFKELLKARKNVTVRSHRSIFGFVPDLSIVSLACEPVNRQATTVSKIRK